MRWFPMPSDHSFDVMTPNPHILATVPMPAPWFPDQSFLGAAAGRLPSGEGAAVDMGWVAGQLLLPEDRVAAAGRSRIRRRQRPRRSGASDAFVFPHKGSRTGLTGRPGYSYRLSGSTESPWTAKGPFRRGLKHQICAAKIALFHRSDFGTIHRPGLDPLSVCGRGDPSH
jgi:hypothetical protein